MLFRKWHGRPMGSLSYMAVIIIGAFLTHRWGWTSSAAPFVLMATASITGSLVLYCRFAFKRDRNPGSIRSLFSDVLRQNWGYGRWVAGVAILFWLANSLYPSLLGIYAGLEAAATLRAAENLLAPLAHTVAALTTVLLPWVSSRLITDGADLPESLRDQSIFNSGSTCRSLCGASVAFRSHSGRSALRRPPLYQAHRDSSGIVRYVCN